MSGELAGYSIIVTGSARGMGAATVRTYAAAGADVVAMDIADAGAEVAASGAEGTTGTVRFMRLDVADADSVTRAFDDAVTHLGKLDVLAHPAAIQRPGDAANVTAEDWDMMFAVNVRGTMLTNQSAHRHMKSNPSGGSIINFGSVSGLRPEPVAPAYSASKGAVHSWTRTAAAAWGVDSVRVNAILPAIATPMYQEAIAAMTDDQKQAHYWQNEASIAMGQRYGDAHRDLGPVMIFFASQGSKFISGQLIPVDGGQTSVR
ncbi:SDR family oxidoreductase [Rhodococcus fascians]|nr:SDR family oxidoreductase [Rhodococcus fascians]MBY4237831.1 SDR family oxidoreductase [Rhodococcus fascians]MBY4253418.1 SDR family oxidoreductase [Rhodococcus fascians]MBY4269055.1 SDR family oxidoreductase [Rhodococcus fascians]MBY4275108.1 SDR family oxidoreductase [Rhodococcus fascians]